MFPQAGMPSLNGGVWMVWTSLDPTFFAAQGRKHVAETDLGLEVRIPVAVR